ncbi:MAG: tyrosine-protein phosphatase [Terriglobales bacterium]
MPNMPIEAGRRGWVDTHVHLLPGLDDGPATEDDARALIEDAIQSGVTHAVATPHANYQFQFEPQVAAPLRARLQEIAGERLQIYLGCELHLSYENLQAALAHPQHYCLNGSRYLLVEFPEHFEPPVMGDALSQLLETGLVPVIAHPERNPVFAARPEALADFLRQGCLAQLTASSFTGRFGKRAQAFAAALLKRQWAHLVATDAHNADKRPPHFDGAHERICQLAGDQVAAALCSDNPYAVIQNRLLPWWPEVGSGKKRGLLSRFLS